jgi:hypothetical protein
MNMPMIDVSVEELNHGVQCPVAHIREVQQEYEARVELVHDEVSKVSVTDEVLDHVHCGDGHIGEVVVAA